MFEIIIQTISNSSIKLNCQIFLHIKLKNSENHSQCDQIKKPFTKGNVPNQWTTSQKKDAKQATDHEGHGHIMKHNTIQK